MTAERNSYQKEGYCRSGFQLFANDLYNWLHFKFALKTQSFQLLQVNSKLIASFLAYYGNITISFLSINFRTLFCSNAIILGLVFRVFAYISPKIFQQIESHGRFFIRILYI